MIGLSALLGCAGPPKTRIDRVYSGLSESLPRLDPSILVGRKILIDPGHGGYFRGTVGQDSLEEAQVNLGVSLYLWGLLNESGAEVHLTRSAERDFLDEADSALAGDLQYRASLAESLGVDMFISIHHNAQGDRDPDVNQVETYYRAGDPASLDLAFSIHRHLMRNLGISTGEVRQGNYYILRHTRMPAVLGEASYLTAPAVEDNLKLSNKQRLEAEAYFLGILDYFHRGIPRLDCISPVDSILAGPPTIVYRSEDTGGLGLDPDAIQMSLNQNPVNPVFHRRTGRITYRLPWDSPNGPYQLTVNVRNLLGNSSRKYEKHFVIDFPPALAVFDTDPETVPPPGGIIRVNARLLDRRGLSIADGTPVDIRVSRGVISRGGAIKNGFLEFWVVPADGNEPPIITISCRGLDFTHSLRQSNAPASGDRGVLLLDEVTGEAIVDAAVLWGDSITQTGSPSGVYLCPTGLPHRETRFLARGYRPLVVPDSTADTLNLSPWYQGKLTGRRFLIDPEGGPPARTGAGQLGLSGAFINLRISRYLAGYLRGAGADVLLSRSSEETRTRQDIVVLANRFKTDRYIAIRQRTHSSQTETPEGETKAVFNTYCFPGSRLGSDWAEKLAFSISGLLELPLTLPGETITYPLQQTACPAVIVEGASLDRLETELLMGQSWYQRLLAYSIFIGTLSHFELSDRASIQVHVRDPENPANWLVVVDDTWTLLTGPDGTATFHILSDGSHTVEIQREDRRYLKQIEAISDIITGVNFDFPAE